jgi:hypothetical protein
MPSNMRCAPYIGQANVACARSGSARMGGWSELRRSLDPLHDLRGVGGGVSKST